MTETDAQLLEAAAKAAGLDFGVIHQRPHRRCPEGWTPWNPLTDDGDALRLAVARDVWVHPGGGREVAEAVGLSSVHEQAGADRGAATRRAIVRAAAAMVA